MMPSSFSSVVKAKIRTLFLSLLVIVTLVLTACGGGTTTTQKTTVLTLTPGPSGDFARNFNPYNTASVNPGARGMIYETLLFLNSLQGTTSPWLASSYQFSKDASTLTFHLRPNVQWSDGQPFSSADVVFTLNLLKQNVALDTNNLWTYLKDVTAPDSSTVLTTESFGARYSSLQLGTFDSAYSFTSSGPTPFFMFNGLLNSTQSAAIGKAAPTNWERWNDATSDKLLNQYASSTDANVQTQALYGLQKILVEQLPAIPMIYGPSFAEYSTAHFTGWPDSNNPYALPSPSYYPDSEIVVLNLHPVG